MYERSRPLEDRPNRSLPRDASNGSRARLRYPGQPVPLWRRLSVLRMRRNAMPTSQALDVLDAFGVPHDGDLEAIVGELIARLDERGLLRDDR